MGCVNSAVKWATKRGEPVKDFIKASWALLVALAGIASSLALFAMVAVLLYIMWTGQDIKNIHVALTVVCFGYAWNKSQRKVSSETGH